MFILFLVWSTTSACIPSISPDNLTTSSTSTTTSSTTTTTTTRTCPTNWLLFNDFCYFFSTAKTPWAQAESNCVGMGAHLASVHSAAENNFIVMQFTTGITQTVINGLIAIGATRSSTLPLPYNFVNTDGTPFDYANWMPGQPDNGGGINPEDCVQIMPDNFSFGWPIATWNDIDCVIPMYWVCKM